jgi:hypothetical protein
MAGNRPRGSALAALSTDEKRRYLWASLSISAGFICMLIGRFLSFPHKHGANVVIGWVLIVLGATVVVVALIVSIRLVLRGRRLFDQSRSV